MNDYKPKLIEVALPLDAINKASVREKSLRHGHPSTLHPWWARRPLAACRAVLWASLVDDPSAHPERFQTEEDQDKERERLFGILEDLVVWGNSNNQDVLREAKAEIQRCFDGELPAVLDPFAGGGSIPLEAQRLGLEALAGDLNPVPVLINKALVEVPPRFAGRPPVHPDAREDLSTSARAPDSGKRSGTQGMSATDESPGSPEEQAGSRFKWDGVQGLAADIKAYGDWMRYEAKRRIGHLYPDIVGTDGERLTPIAWIWARTVESPDPAWGGHVPLVTSWTLRRAKKGKPEVWVEPIVDHDAKSIEYRVNYGGRDILSTPNSPHVVSGYTDSTEPTFGSADIPRGFVESSFGSADLLTDSGEKVSTSANSTQTAGGVDSEVAGGGGGEVLAAESKAPCIYTSGHCIYTS